MTKPGLHFLITMVAGWVHRHQLEVIEYLQDENRLLRERLGPTRLRFSDAERRRLAIAGKRVGRKGLFGIGTIVTPDTLLRWYRRLVAQKYDGSRARGVGRPRSAAEIERLVITMAQANPGYVKLTAIGPAQLRACRDQRRNSTPSRRSRPVHLAAGMI